MKPVRHNASLSSSERKRLRDRKAQKTLREKRERHIKGLEDRVAHCELHHGDNGTQQLLATVANLRQENDLFRARQERLRKMIASWDSDDDIEAALPSQQAPSSTGIDLSNSPQVVLPSFHRPDGALVASSGRTVPGQGPPSSYNAPSLGSFRLGPTDRRTILQSCSPQDTTTTGSVTPEPIHPPRPSNAVPGWQLVPPTEYSHGVLFSPPTCPWLARPDLVSASPSHPSPLDILHGTRRNFLADQIHRAIRRRAVRDAECLALGWLIYSYSKWFVSPSPSAYSRLARFQRPVMAQLRQGHPASLDLIPWPQMRVNFIKNWTKYDLVEFTGYMSCCTKLRWPWGEDMLERDEDDNLQMRQEFSDVFTQESGWGLTTEFIEKYPELLEGMDVEALRFRITLPTEEDLLAHTLKYPTWG